MKLNKKQKRTATIASMAALLAVVLGMGGQTFAKYITTTKTESHTAVVAKWGVVIKADAKDMFGKNYTDGKIETSGTGAGVSASGTSDVVAPGTEGSTTIEIEGVPEVSAAITFDVTGKAIGIYSDATTITYEPIVWSVTKTDTTATPSTVENLTFSGLQSYFDSQENNALAPNTNLKATYKISWKWAFDVEDNSATTDVDESKVRNDNDTYLGNLAADLAAGKATDTNSNTEFTFGITVSVVQTKE